MISQEPRWHAWKPNDLQMLPQPCGTWRDFDFFNLNVGSRLVGSMMADSDGYLIGSQLKLVGRWPVP